MIKKLEKNKLRQVRHARVRAKIQGTTQRPRLNVFRSNKHIYVQIIDDMTGQTLVSASTIETSIKGEIAEMGRKEAANLIGQTAAKRALEADIDTVVFDRGGYIYHGRVKEVAKGARKGGLKF